MGIRREITPVFVSPLCLRSSSEDELEEFEDEEDEEEEDEDEEEDDDEDDDEELEEEEEDDLCLLGFLWCLSSALPKKKCYIEGLVQKRRNSSALAMELRLSCTNPSISFWTTHWPLGDVVYCNFKSVISEHMLRIKCDVDNITRETSWGPDRRNWLF